MFCRKCGKELENGARFCGNCGEKVEVFEMNTSSRDEASSQEKGGINITKILGEKKILLVAAIGVLILLVIILIMPKNETKNPNNIDGGMGNEVNQSQENEVDPNTLIEESLVQYYQTTILSTMQVMNKPESSATYGYEEVLELQNMAGVATYKIFDWDRDGAVEMLLIYSDAYNYFARVYEVEDGVVIQKSEAVLGNVGYSTADYTDSVFIVYTSEADYLFYADRASAAIADGYCAELSLCKYDGTSIVRVMDVEQTNGGSTDFEYEAHHYNPDGSLKECDVIYREYGDGFDVVIADEDGSIFASQFSRYGIDIKSECSMFDELENIFADSVNRELIYRDDQWAFVHYTNDGRMPYVTIFYNDSDKKAHQVAVGYEHELKEILKKTANNTFGTKYCYYDIDKDGYDELIVNIDDHMRFEIYTVKGSYCYLMDHVDNGAGARHDFNLTENGYCFTYYDIMPDGAIYTSYYYVASSYYLEIVARSTSVFTTTGESTTYEIMRDGDYVQVDVAEFNSVVAKSVENLNWYDLNSTADIRLPGGYTVEFTEPISAFEGDYVLPQSSSAYLTIADLEGLSAAECRLARNEIYARHGRIFLAEDLKAYFESKSWYRGTIHPDNFTEDMLNQYELYNRDLITQYETDNGYNQ